MIQRIQSVYLLLTIACLALFSFVFPYVKTINGEQIMAISDLYVYAAPVASMLLSAIILLLFKNRKLQIKLASLNQVLILLSFAGVAYGLNKLGDDFESLGAGVYALAMTFILISAAKRNIKKDQELIDSVDRIR